MKKPSEFDEFDATLDRVLSCPVEPRRGKGTLAAA
jgi:hypothetical protein